MNNYSKRLLLSEKRRLILIRKYIDSNLDKDLRVPVLAALFGIGIQTMTRQFKLAYGMSPVCYVLHKRMEKAHSLISAAALPINMVGSKVGYNNRCSFTKAFCKFYGYAPAKLYFRNLQRDKAHK